MDWKSRKVQIGLAVVIVGLVALFMFCGKAQAEEPMRLTPAEWTVPISVGYAKGLTFGVGGGYRFKDGTEIQLQAAAQVRNSLDGTATGPYDYDFHHRWPVVDVTVPYHVPSETVYGVNFTVVIPVRR